MTSNMEKYARILQKFFKVHSCIKGLGGISGSTIPRTVIPRSCQRNHALRTHSQSSMHCRSCGTAAKIRLGGRSKNFQTLSKLSSSSSSGSTELKPAPPSTASSMVSPASKTTRSGDRQKLVILGTGWGSYSVLKSIDKSLYDVVVVSPRNHFLFTPLLASTTVGTLEFRLVLLCCSIFYG